MQQPLENIFVTIGLTCFNAEKTIKRAISSALNQDWENKEIIIIDDGSTDNSQEIIEGFLSNKEIIFLKNISNRGTSYTRNRIIDSSKGNLICFMDDDDFSEPNRVTLQVKEFVLNGFPKKNIWLVLLG